MPTLHWVGKDKVVRHHHDVPFKVLQQEYHFESSNPSANTTGNKIIHGDNLEALKALLPEYEGRIKCIYIDPPYNTGNEGWVYNDNVNDPRILKWLHKVVGKEGEDLSRHDKWLCMMYPRLKLLHRLLGEDGFIFVSIDTFEFANLKIILDDIFGIQNFRNCISVRRGIKNVQSQFEDLQALSLGHEYLFLYSKSRGSKLPKLSKKHDVIKPGKWDTFWRGTDRPTMRYDIFGIKPTSGQWRWEKERTNKAISNYNNFLENYSTSISIDDFHIEHLQATNEKLDFVRLNSENVVQYYVPPQNGKLASDNWMDLTLSGSFTTFDTEKNAGLIERIIGWITVNASEDVILDSFAGSGTTAHAVLKLNAQDGGNRKFILVEMMDYAETITAERVRRVMDGYGENLSPQPSTEGRGSKTVEGLGGGFEYYTLGESLFNESGQLNEAVGVAAILRYVAYSERIKDFSSPHPGPLPQGEGDKNGYYHLGETHGVQVHFIYQPDTVTSLDLDLLAKLAIKPGKRVIYADQCLLGEEFMRRHGIIFKKIPRDITRF